MLARLAHHPPQPIWSRCAVGVVACQPPPVCLAQHAHLAITLPARRAPAPTAAITQSPRPSRAPLRCPAPRTRCAVSCGACVGPVLRGLCLAEPAVFQAHAHLYRCRPRSNALALVSRHSLACLHAEPSPSPLQSAPTATTETLARARRSAARRARQARPMCRPVRQTARSAYRWGNSCPLTQRGASASCRSRQYCCMQQRAAAPPRLQQQAQLQTVALCISCMKPGLEK